MAILMRGGPYEDFDPSKLRPREWAIVLENDPGAKDGKTVRICFSAGNTKRMATYEDMVEDIENATEDIRDRYIAMFNDIKLVLEQIQQITETYKNTAESKAEEAKNSADAAKESESRAAASASNAEDYSLQSKSYAVGEGGVRENEKVDNSKYYYEQAKHVSQRLEGALLTMGTIYFYELSAVDAEAGYMYNIKDAFVTDETFKEGAGFFYSEGTNVYRTADGYWDCLAGIQVTGVKGSEEEDYRTGRVNISKENIGIVVATTENIGLVRPDGETIEIDPDGTIHGSAQVDIATAETLGIVKPDGTTITVDAEGTITGAASGFTGTKAEVDQAIQDREIKEGMIVNITDDYNGTLDGGAFPPGLDIKTKSDASEKDFVMADIGGEKSKISFENISKKISLTSLDTKNKTLVGAINEVYSNIGNGDESEETKIYNGTNCTVKVNKSTAIIEIQSKRQNFTKGTLLETTEIATLPANIRILNFSALDVSAALVLDGPDLVGVAGICIFGANFDKFGAFTLQDHNDAHIRGRIVVLTSDLIIT